MFRPQTDKDIRKDQDNSDSIPASIAIEKPIILHLRSRDQLYDQYIEKVIQKDWRMDFLFKWTSLVRQT